MEYLPKDLANSGALDIKNHLESISGGKVLDVATQGGGFIRTLIDLLLDYDFFIGIDISKKEWNDDRFTNYHVEFIEMNAELLYFNDSTFDTVCMSHSLHHLASIEKVLIEMNRVLKPNGYLLLQEMYRDGVQTDAQKSDILSHHWGAKVDSLFGISHNRTLTKQEILQFIGRLNLKNRIILESTHYVKCITCDDKFKCDNPKNPNIINFALKEVNKNLEKLQKGLDDGILENRFLIKKLLLEGEKIKTRIKQYGSAPASQLFVIGKK